MTDPDISHHIALAYENHSSCKTTTIINVTVDICTEYWILNVSENGTKSAVIN